jgi:hypothetical protein
VVLLLTNVIEQVAAEIEQVTLIADTSPNKGAGVGMDVLVVSVPLGKSVTANRPMEIAAMIDSITPTPICFLNSANQLHLTRYGRFTAIHFYILESNADMFAKL